MRKKIDFTAAAVNIPPDRPALITGRWARNQQKSRVAARARRLEKSVSRPGRCAKSNPMESELGAGDSKCGTPIRVPLALQDATIVRRPNSTQLDAMPTVRCGELQSGNSRHKLVQKTSIRRVQRSNRHYKATASCRPPNQAYFSTKNRVAVPLLRYFGPIATPE